MKRLPALACLLLCTAGTAQAIEPMNILGLPLGGRLETPVRQCSADELGTEVKTLCWVKRPPQQWGGTRSGRLRVPGADGRPQWAANGSFDASVKGDGTLSSFTIRTTRADEFAEILDSIAVSLGPPKRESRPGASTSSAEWDWKDAHVELMCAADFGCKASFAVVDRAPGKQRDYAERYLIEPQPVVPPRR